MIHIKNSEYHNVIVCKYVNSRIIVYKQQLKGIFLIIVEISMVATYDINKLELLGNY